MKTQTSSNIIHLPLLPSSPHRRNARKILEMYYKKKAREAEQARVGLTQEQIDGRGPNWEKESDSTNAKMARIMGGEN